jgi:hypothetical protein
MIMLVGCADTESGSDGGITHNASEPRPSVTLRVLVVNEPELLEAIGRLRGEWTERSGGQLSASGVTWQEIAKAENVGADLIVFPSRYLGELCLRKWLRPVRAGVLESESLDAADFFPMVRRDLIAWDGQAMALPLGVHVAINPKAVERDSAVALLVEAAPEVVSNDRIGTLFDTETMRPRITEPPFVDALARLAKSNESGAPREDSSRRVPVLGFADRLIAVTSGSRNAASAFELAEWLASADISSQFARAGDGAMPVRRSLASSAAWYDSNFSASERADLGKRVEAALSVQRGLIVPRIAGVDEYMAALDEAVNDAASKKTVPQAALEKAAKRWEEITDAHGRDAQRAAYLKHLGIGES